jgi:hypothetical protein
VGTGQAVLPYGPYLKFFKIVVDMDLVDYKGHVRLYVEVIGYVQRLPRDKLDRDNVPQLVEVAEIAVPCTGKRIAIYEL